MDAAAKSQLSGLVNSLPGLAGVGVVYLGQQAADQSVLRLAPAGAPYVVIEEIGTTLSAATSARLRSLGVVLGSLRVVGVTSDGFRISEADAGNFGDTPGVGGGDMMAKMAAMNMQFLALQEAVQMESRRFQTLSSASKTRHDIALNAIRNMK